MKITNYQHSQRRIIMKITKQLNHSIVSVIFIMTISGITQAQEPTNKLALLDSVEKWQMNRLFEPTINQLKKETSGKIMIYEGLRDTVITKALNKHFNRIENMMFTKVIVTDKNGEPKLDIAGKVTYEDDGC